MKITCLAENTAIDKNIIAEHGLSLFIETKDKKILFDMGQSDSFAINAEKLGINLSEADIAVLSHGHYDHGGGLEAFLELNTKAYVYLSRFAFEPHYNGTEKYIGLDVSLFDNERLIFTDDFTRIDDSVFIYSCNDIEMINDIDSGGLNMICNGETVPDDFRHEQFLVIEDNEKKILFSGCSHKGIINICDIFVPDVLIGGFHFSKYSLDEKLIGYARRLNEYNTEFYTCHCTGTEQYDFMKPHIEKLNYLSAGQTIII